MTIPTAESEAATTRAALRTLTGKRLLVFELIRHLDIFHYNWKSGMLCSMGGHGYCNGCSISTHQLK